jgi:hypothetical protein
MAAYFQDEIPHLQPASLSTAAIFTPCPALPGLTTLTET